MPVTAAPRCLRIQLRAEMFSALITLLALVTAVEGRNQAMKEGKSCE